MHTLLSVQEAFAAKQAGKNVVCRHAESEFFEDLGNVSAETWFDPHYVFAIQIDTITLGDFEFAKPFTLEELSPGQDIFYIGASGTILKGTFNPANEMLISGVNNGSVQRDEENAVIQIKAFRSLLGITSDEPTVVDYDFFVVDGESPKPETKKRGGRKKKDTETTVVESEQQVPEHEPLDKQQTLENTTAIVQDYISQLDKCMTVDDVMQVRYTLSADNRLDREQVQSLNERGEQRLESIYSNSETKDTNAQPKFKKAPLTSEFLEQILAAKTVDELTVISEEIKQTQTEYPASAGAYDFLIVEIEAQKEELNQLDLIDCNQNSSINIVDRIDLTNTLIDLDVLEETLTLEQKDQYQFSLQNKRQALVKLSSIPTSDEMKSLSIDTHNRYRTRIAEANSLVTIAGIDRDIGDDRHLNSTQKAELLSELGAKRSELHFNFLYEKKLTNLIGIVQQAQSVDEANEPASQTLDWTVEQRLPLITAISKRLVELGKPLVTQIREASDLNTLDAYLAQIKEMVAVDGTLAHQLMITHVAKKAELEKQVAT
ncbi:hypothetical protein EAH57_14995 [Acinetobacter sp. 2JN-4]|uniref:hypothetical protein n=1 Tax=Acinetobacter sp. 2JN-4 TaxID=2479844 RepID=UPI000EFA2663|nr:hypothetical protein [Acinetobacter sp. 2JN-4]RLZ06834.1 hypothetical protein EAH57_14995 [Acinetobacter sp. 2JN-4]